MSITRTAADRGVPVMDLLRNGVPLTLLLDLVLGPHSTELMAHERACVPAQRTPTS